MGNNLSAAMLLMGAGTAQDVTECGKIRILGLYLQDTTPSFDGCLGSGAPFAREVSAFMDKANTVYPGSMFGVYGYTDRGYDPVLPTHHQTGDFVVITPLVDVTTAQSQISKLHTPGGGGQNTDAFDVMYHLVVDVSDSGIDKVPPLSDTYDAKVLYVFSDGIPQYAEATSFGCIPETEGNPMRAYPCVEWCFSSKPGKCCNENATGDPIPVTSMIDYGTKWNPTATCPIDLTTLGQVIKENDWYVAYIAASDNPKNSYDWSKQVKLMGIESRFTTYGIEYSYAGLSDALVDITSKIMCSTIPSNNPSGLPTGVPTVAPVTGGPTVAPAPTTGGGGESCGARVQYVHAQDLTASSGDDLPNVQHLLPEAIQDLADTYPGSLFAISQFHDKDDTSAYFLDCDLTTDLTKVSTAIKNWPKPLGGYDTPEDSLGAVWSILRGDKSNPRLTGVTWAPPEAGLTDVKIIGIATDVGGHFKDDESFYGSPDTFTPNAGENCTGIFYCPYMDPADIGKAIIDDDIYILVMAAPSDESNNTTPGVWEELLDMMGITDRGVIVNLTADSSNMFDIIKESIAHISCDIATTTGGPTVAPTVGPTGASTGASTGAPTGASTVAPWTGQGGTTTTTTEKPFPVGLVAGCAAGAVAAVAAAAVAARAMGGTPAQMEFEFEGEEAGGPEEMERETQVALGETDFA